MSTCRQANHDHFWRRCCRKFSGKVDTGSRNGRRHHSIRRWKNVQELDRSTHKPPAEDYAAVFGHNLKERALEEAQRWQQLAPGAQPTGSHKTRRTVSGAATAPALSSGVSSTGSLSPQTFTTAEAAPNQRASCDNDNYDAPRPTLDPRSSCSFRSNIKSARFQRMLPEQRDSDPSFTFGFTAAGNSADSSLLNSSDGDYSCIGSSGAAANSPNFEHMVSSFDWYATSVFKKLETSVFSLLNLREEFGNDKSTGGLAVSPLSELQECDLTPCTGAATKWNRDVDEAIYGHHAKCFI